MMGEPHYTLEIKWSDEDQCYVVFAPEWEYFVGPIADGATYEEAAARGRNALENMIDFAQERGDPLPQPKTFA
jgi:predicted RNase H-like HicB family nuclease